MAIDKCSRPVRFRVQNSRFSWVLSRPQLNSKSQTGQIKIGVFFLFANWLDPIGSNSRDYFEESDQIDWWFFVWSLLMKSRNPTIITVCHIYYLYISTYYVYLYIYLMRIDRIASMWFQWYPCTKKILVDILSSHFHYFRICRWHVMIPWCSDPLGSRGEATRSYYLLGNEVPKDLESLRSEIQCLNDYSNGQSTGAPM